MKELKYSEAAAQRRISAMKLISEIPEIEQKIKEGTLSLSTVSQVQSVCRSKQEFKSEFKKELLKAVEGKSKRQAEKILAQVAPKPVLPEKRRVLNDKQTEVRFVVSEQLEYKLERIKALTSHKKFNPSYAELIETMADLVLQRIDPKRRKAKTVRSKQTGLKQMNTQQKTQSPPLAEVIPTKSVNSAEQHMGNTKPAKPPRYIRIDDKRALYHRAGSRCEHVHPITKYRCTQTRCLQVDHIIPVACGGGSGLENLRLLCFAHNQLAAQHVFGKEKMDSYRRGRQTLYPPENTKLLAPSPAWKMSFLL